MSEMVERVARSVCIALGREPECWADSEQLRDKCRAIARVAIKAMRDPPDDMLDAMNDVWINGGDYSICVSIEECGELFNAAIDAALGPTP